MTVLSLRHTKMPYKRLQGRGFRHVSVDADGHHQQNLGDLLHLSRVREIPWTRP